MRTLEQVRERFDKSLTEDTFLNFRIEVLGAYLADKLEDPTKVLPLTEEAVKAELLDYLDFAFGKAINHRGISASRSIQKLSTWAWILDLDDLVAFAEDDKNYPQYGVPILKKFAEHFEIEMPEAILDWPDGKPCVPNCDEGCGLPDNLNLVDMLPEVLDINTSPENSDGT